MSYKQNIEVTAQGAKHQFSVFYSLLKVMGLLIVLMLTSCEPNSKEAYMEVCSEFMAEVTAEHASYSAQDWEDADAQYELVTGDWYLKFKDELTWNDKIELKKYQLQYNLLKVNEGVSHLFDPSILEDYDKIKAQLKYYAEEGMYDDIDKLMKEAKALSDSATEAVEKALDELEINLEDLQE